MFEMPSPDATLQIPISARRLRDLKLIACERMPVGSAPNQGKLLPLIRRLNRPSRVPYVDAFD